MKSDLDGFVAEVSEKLKDCDDFVCYIGNRSEGRFALMFIKGITSRDYISERLLRPLQKCNEYEFGRGLVSLLECPNITDIKSPAEAASGAVRGEVIVAIENESGASFVLANAETTHGRSVEEPSSDVTVRGPKAGFVEDAETNMTLIRKYIRTSDLKFKRFTVGSVSQTKVIMAYVSGRADERLVGSLGKRIDSLDASVITDSANISMLLEGRSNRLLPTCGSTEKVDKAASKLMAGRIAIIVDGSPFVLTLPYVFAESLQSSEDYLHTPFYATFIRILRLVAFITAIFAPAVLCTVVNRNPSAMPEELYGLISESRKDIPISFFWEIIGILTLFELLREVGVRMPRTVGDAVGLVGSIVLGNTAVEAGIVSSVGVIIVALAAVCAFISPAYMYVIVLTRLFTLVASELFGIYGLVLSAVVFFLSLCFKRSFGVHYMYPLVPFDKKGMRDFIFCWPKRALGRREKLNKE